MNTAPHPAPVTATPQQEISALRVALRILEQWQCNPTEKAVLLGTSVSTVYALAEAAERRKHLDKGLVERVSYILNIHAALRVLFALPESIYGWVRKTNDHPFFAGRSAMEVMLQGRVADLYEVSQRLQAARGGWA